MIFVKMLTFNIKESADNNFPMSLQKFGSSIYIPINKSISFPSAIVELTKHLGFELGIKWAEPPGVVHVEDGT